ncbi:MAG: rod-binding protein [Sulfurimonas sp.]|nr:rod-binding protein [Sulfurimonas sp.]
MYGSSTVALNASLMAQNQNIPSINEKYNDAQLREQTDAFESVILKMLMDNAMKNQEDLFSSQKDPGDKIYKSMYREELAKASAGGFGFSQMLFEYLSEKR